MVTNEKLDKDNTEERVRYIEVNKIRAIGRIKEDYVIQFKQVCKIIGQNNEGNCGYE